MTDSEPVLKMVSDSKDRCTGSTRKRNSDRQKLVIKKLRSSLIVYKKQIDEQKKALEKVKRLKDFELEGVVRELLLLESQLRKEQKEIYKQLIQKEKIILSQKQELEKLRRENRRLSVRVKKSHESSETEPSRKPERVLHKPPIAEKPKNLKSNKKYQKNSALVSTIHKLLEEDSDRGFPLSSGDSESSSPESTLKPTPRVIKLARQYDKGTISNIEYVKPSLFTDDQEVTSGYNSESVSEQEHDYENTIVTSNQIENRTTENDYVIFSVVKDSIIQHTDQSSSDSHVYSNIEFHGGIFLDPPKCRPYNEPLDLSDTASETTSTSCDSIKGSKNVPRTRDNINQIIEYVDNPIMENFEEFSLDSLDLDNFDDNQYSGKENEKPFTKRRDDSSKNQKNQTDITTLSDMASLVALLPPGGCYDKFLDATGLSQKSILTPSRMFSNHRSMLKPRDIKHRNRLRAIFTGLSTLEESSDSLKPKEQFL